MRDYEIAATDGKRDYEIAATDGKRDYEIAATDGKRDDEIAATTASWLLCAITKSRRLLFCAKRFLLLRNRN